MNVQIKYNYLTKNLFLSLFKFFKFYNMDNFLVERKKLK